MKRFGTIDARRERLLRIIMRSLIFSAAMAVLCVPVRSQRIIRPPADIEREVRELLRDKYFPASPDSVMTCAWDSVFMHVDRYTRISKASPSAVKAFYKNSWFDFMFPDTVPPPKYFGFTYDDGVVMNVQRSSACYRGGLCIGDRIVRINGVETHGNDSILRMLFDAIPVTDTAHFEVQRGDRHFALDLVRDIVIENCVAARRDSRTIFVRIAEFDEGAADEFDREVGGSIGYNNIDSMIIDLRSNPGGNVRELVQLLNLFCPKGTVVFKQISRTDTMMYRSDNLGHPLVRIPHLQLLVDSNSASAAEAFVGCLKVHRNVEVLGTRTFGKGIVQTERMIGDYRFRMTTAEYFAGGTMKIHKRGIGPDGPVPEWLVRNPGISSTVARLDMARLREKYARYPIDMALQELGVDRSQGVYIFGLDAEVYYLRPNTLAKK